ncbi:hypothetical protein AYI70_g1561 [Smittium culicis]|uniref:Uncharacterized protein n=1 Tax=Smittium culicis TaxID=133412 RepID=A0A1R1YCC3_9FUNG|nr:hypothetical protein AYI70_g1561 [Smittium culicis]
MNGFAAYVCSDDIIGACPFKYCFHSYLFIPPVFSAKYIHRFVYLLPFLSVALSPFCLSPTYTAYLFSRFPSLIHYRCAIYYPTFFPLPPFLCIPFIMDTSKDIISNPRSSEGLVINPPPAWCSDQRKPSTTDIKQKVLELFAELLDSQPPSKTSTSKKSSPADKLSLKSEPCYYDSSPPLQNSSSNISSNLNLNPDPKPSALIHSSILPQDLKPQDTSAPSTSSQPVLNSSAKKRKASLEISTNNLFKKSSLNNLKKNVPAPNTPSLAVAPPNLQPRATSSIVGLNLNSIPNYPFTQKPDPRSSSLNLPSHPLIKSKSEVWPHITNSPSSSSFQLKATTPRLPRRNLKPLDFSSSNKKFNSSNFFNKTNNYSNDTFSDLTSSIDPLSHFSSDSFNQIPNNQIPSNIDFSLIPSTPNLNTNDKSPQSVNPFANLLSDAHKRFDNTNHTSSLNHTNYLSSHLNPQNKGIVIGGPPPDLSSATSFTNIDPSNSNINNNNNNNQIIQAIENAVYLASKSNSNKVYSLWNPNDPNTANPPLKNISSFKIPNATSSLPSTSNNFPILPAQSILPSELISCKYCNKLFKSVQKKLSHEHRCSYKLEALLYSQPEFNDHNDRLGKNKSPTSQNLDSLLESVPDLSDSDNEFSSHNPYHKINSESNIFSHIKPNLDIKPNSSIGINVAKSLKPKKSSKKHPSKPLNLKSKPPIVDSEDTMSLSEGSELTRFHFQNNINRNYLLSDNIHNLNSDQAFPNLPINHKNGLMQLNNTSLNFNLQNNNMPLNINDNPLNLASEPPIPWNNDALSFNPNDNSTPNVNSSFLNNATDKIDSNFRSANVDNNNDFSALLNSLAGSSAQHSNDILNSILMKNSSFATSNAEGTFNNSQFQLQQIPESNLQIQSQSLNQTQNQSQSQPQPQSVNTKAKIKGKGKGKTPVMPNQNLSLNNYVNNTPLVASNGFSPNNHGSSSTITLPQDNDDYQFMDEQELANDKNAGNQAESNTNHSKENFSKANSTARPVKIEASSSKKPTNILPKNSVNSTSRNSLFDSPLVQDTKPLASEITNNSSILSTFNNNFSNTNCHSNSPATNKNTASSQSFSKNTNGSHNLSNEIKKDPSDLAQPTKNQLLSEPINFYSTGNPNLDSLFSLDYLNQPMFDQFDNNDRGNNISTIDSLLADQMNSQSNFINWANCDENVERELEGLFNFD